MADSSWSLNIRKGVTLLMADVSFCGWHDRTRLSGQDCCGAMNEAGMAM